MLHTYKTSPSYIVEDRRFYTRWAAISYAISRKTTDVKFDMFDDVFSKIDWTVEPDIPWEVLLDLRATQIKESGRPVVLMFSGGTDSLTVYQSLIRNDVRIDQIIIGKTPSHNSWSKDAIEWIGKNHKDKNTVINIFEHYEWYDRVFNSENVLYEKPIIGVFGTGMMFSDEYLSQLRNQYRDPIILTGVDKPQLFYDKGQIYSHQNDFAFLYLMPPLDIEYFFITPDLPELHVKQSWMLKKWIESQTFKVTKKFINNDIYDSAIFDYATYCFAVGRRDGDLSLSHQQKIINRYSRFIIDKNNYANSRLLGRGHQIFKELLATGNKGLLNYLKSTAQVRQEIGDGTPWLHDNRVAPIYSKKHCLGRLNRIVE